jgi:predicted NBD/HSP70 family sugar kinase
MELSWKRHPRASLRDGTAALRAERVSGVAMTYTIDSDSELAGPSRELAREVLIHGPISRAELGRRLGLSPASLTRLSKPFLDRGLFVDGPENSERSVGRPAKPLDVRVDAQRYVGIKITGDEALGVATNLRADPLGSVSVALASHSVDDVVAAVRQVVEKLGVGRELGVGKELGGTAELSAVGISIGGKVTESRVVARAPFLGWRDVDLGGLVSADLGLPVTVENDVVALVAAEHWFGVAKGIENFALITTGAGVGYGLVIHDRSVVTADTGLGLGGHFPLDPTGPLCIDGHRGCSTAMLSIPSMCASARIGLGYDVSYPELLQLASDGNPVAVAVVDSAARALGRMIAATTNLTMVDTVVLSGEGIALTDVALDVIHAAVATDRDPDAAPVRLLVDDSGFSAWARGAAASAIQASFGLVRA